MSSIQCGHCRQTHGSVGEVRACAEGGPNADQLRYIERLCKERGTDFRSVRSRIRTFEQARGLIRLLEREVAQREAKTKMQPPLPKSMIERIQPGRYAVRMGEEFDWVFFRVSIPKTGKNAGYLKIQTQHAENLLLRLMFTTAGQPCFVDNSDIKKQRLQELLIMIISDQYTAAIDYGTVMKRCCRCGINLTDGRSQWYGIGSECEKQWPWVVTNVEDTRGVYIPAAQREAM